jgi:hypothetical protein
MQTSDLTMRRLLIEALVALAISAVLVGAAIWIRAPDLAMLGTLAPFPLFLLILIRRHLSLARKISYAGPLPALLPVLLFLAWTNQFPGRPMYFLIAALAGAVFMVSTFACVRVLWEVR